MQRRLAILLSLSLLFSLSLSPISGQETVQQTDFWACPREFAGQELHVFNWTTYIAEDTISNFEELCDVQVVYDTYSSDTEILDWLQAGNRGYDIVVPTDSTVYLLIAENLLQPLNFDHLPNLANITETLKSPPYDPGNRYTVPYQWGTIGIGYNRTRVGKDITSWNDLFTYTGPVAWLEDDRAMLGVALRLLGFDPNTDQ
ncbi:MAG TPA: spermidine/putrescine ABC transporter substrate-binding protein, partial [Phototrophicaceae bacterium]|nr:spermidine/putrescine ABC transporter substrate-binding protein [Phototrophicaceae bacterium]